MLSTVKTNQGLVKEQSLAVVNRSSLETSCRRVDSGRDWGGNQISRSWRGNRNLALNDEESMLF